MGLMSRRGGETSCRTAALCSARPHVSPLCADAVNTPRNRNPVPRTRSRFAMRPPSGADGEEIRNEGARLIPPPPTVKRNPSESLQERALGPFVALLGAVSVLDDEHPILETKGVLARGLAIDLHGQHLAGDGVMPPQRL